jgi:hypothetical protein
MHTRNSWPSRALKTPLDSECHEQWGKIEGNIKEKEGKREVKKKLSRRKGRIKDHIWIECQQ